MESLKTNQRVVSFLLALAMLVFIMSTGMIAYAKDTDFAGGSGTEADPYLIATKEQLNNVRNDIEAHYKLISDINFSDNDFIEGGDFYNNGMGWIPIAGVVPDSPNWVYPFNGTFDGNNHSINNLHIVRHTEFNDGETTSDLVGLFGSIGSSGIVSNLNMNFVSIDVYSTSFINVGCISGDSSGKIQNCRVQGEIKARAGEDSISISVGGICGFSSWGIFKSCRSDVKIDCLGIFDRVGGICGTLQEGSISSCINTGNVSGTYSVGGIVADIFISSSVKMCSNYGNVTAHQPSEFNKGSTDYISTAAGIVNDVQSDCVISQCMNAGEVVAIHKYGKAAGIVGFLYQNSILTDCFNVSSITATSVAAGIICNSHYCSIKNCYNVGEISSLNSAGIVNSVEGTSDELLSNCYYLDNIAIGVGSGGFNATKCSQEELSVASTFTGFDFKNIWEITENTQYLYPTLKNNKNLLCNHTYTVQSIPATCIDWGCTTYICYTCGDCYSEDYTEALGHDFGEWQINEEASCTQVGIETRYCSRCDETETKTVEKTEHSYVSIVTPPLCEEEGYTTYLCNCGDSYISDIISPKGHVPGEWTITAPETAVKDGEKTKFCSECGDTLDTQKIPAFGKVSGVAIDNISMNYHKSTTIKPIITIDAGVDYTISYISSDSSIVMIDNGGNVYTVGKGTATITCEVTDQFGNTVSDTCEVNSTYNFGQWLIIIFLFGWIWY